MEGKKLYIFIGILAFILVSPIAAFNNASMGCYQARIDKYPESKSSKDWQLKLATIYYNTLRTEKAGECYEKFYTKWPEEPRRPMALEQRARIYEELGMKAEAIAVWKMLAREHSEHNLGKLAEAKLQNDYKIYTLD